MVHLILHTSPLYVIDIGPSLNFDNPDEAGFDANIKKVINLGAPWLNADDLANGYINTDLTIKHIVHEIEADIQPTRTGVAEVNLRLNLNANKGFNKNML